FSRRRTRQEAFRKAGGGGDGRLPGRPPKGQGPELMVKWFPDRTGRFSQRPHFEPKELDRECENIIAGFLKARHGAAKYPVSTDDLTVLIERDTDLSGYGRNVEGLTHFQPGRKPRVKI